MTRSLKCDLGKTLISAGFLAAVIVTLLLCFTESAYVGDFTLTDKNVKTETFSVYSDGKAV